MNIERDLARLGCADPSPSFRAQHPFAPLAIEYILVGSSLGLRMLIKRWQGTSDPRVESTCNFLRGADRTPLWRDMCDRLACLPADTAEADAITADCRRIFDLYAREAQRVSPNPKDPYREYSVISPARHNAEPHIL